MNLAVFLSPGDSLQKQSLYGQDERFIEYYLKPYCEVFNKVFIFSYADMDYRKKLPIGAVLIRNKNNLSYFFYQLIFPFVYRKELKSCSCVRVMQATGGIPAIISKLLYGNKIAVTYGYDYQNFARFERKWLRAYIMKLIIPIVLRLSDKIIVTNKLNYQVFSKSYSGKVILMPNGTEVKKSKTKDKILKTHIKNKKIKILSIGRLVRQKNLDLIISAIQLIRNKNNIYLTIVGCGSQRDILKRKAREVGINLNIVGTVPHSKLIKYYLNADVFCLPSLAEGQSKVLLEAMSFGLPVLASSTPENKELVENKINGLLFNPNPRDLSEKISWLTDNPGKAFEFGMKARLYIKNNHNIVKLINKEIKILKNV